MVAVCENPVDTGEGALARERVYRIGDVTVEAVWTGTDVETRFQVTGAVGATGVVTLTGAALDLFRSSDMAIVLREVTDFRAAWRRTVAAPTRFGAVPVTRQGMDTVFVAPDVEVSPGTWIPFGTPTVSWRSTLASDTNQGTPAWRDEWTVTLAGMRGPLTVVGWDDTAGMADVIGTLDDVDQWRAMAALQAPDMWAAAVRAEEARLAEQQRIEEQREQRRAAVAALANPDHAVSVRKTMKAIRGINWRAIPGLPVHWHHEIEVQHVDMGGEDGVMYRVAEAVTVPTDWHAPGPRTAVQKALTDALAPAGLQVVFGRSRRIYVVRDAETARPHIAEISRNRSNRTLTVPLG